MRLLTNENVSGTVVRTLRERGHDVLSAKESMRSEPDEILLARAQAEGRILVTHDKDFGELAFHSGLPARCGVILLRLTGDGPESDNCRALEVIESREDWPGHIELLPAWPREYPDGSIGGVLVRGGHKLDLTWAAGKVVSATLHAGRDDRADIIHGAVKKTVAFKAGSSYRFDGRLQTQSMKTGK